MSNTREQDETNEIIEGKLAHLKYVLSSVDKHDAKVDGKPNDKFLDSIMALELNSMSFQERGLAYEEIHGVDDIVAETPEFVAEKLAALDEALFCIKNKPAYDQAVQANREYVKGHKFRLMFLRSERFNCEKAASRLVNFVEGKLQYFGPDSLGRPILFRDLDRDDVAALKTGYVQLLPSRDSAGRLIICAVATPIKSAKSMVRHESAVISDCMDPF